MTQQEHTIIATIICMILYQIIFHKYIKNHPITKKARKEWLRIMGKYI